MISYYFTKPFQGKLFKLFNDIIMGYKHIVYILADIEFNSKECAGNQNKVTKKFKSEK